MLIKIRNYEVNIEVVNGDNPEAETKAFLNEICALAFDSYKYNKASNYKGLAHESKKFALDVFDFLYESGYYKRSEEA